MSNGKQLNSDGQELDNASASILFKALLKQTQDQVYFKDRQSRFVKVSDVMAKKFGQNEPSDLIGKTDFNFFTLEHAQAAYDDEQRLMNENDQLINLVEKETWPDGRVTWANSTKIPLILESGEVAGVIGISRDITEQILAQQELEEHRALLQRKNEIMESDLQSAKTVQRLTIPGPTPNCPFAEIAVSIVSLNEVSGDLVTFPCHTDNQLSFILGDISGHGITAGLFTMLVKHLADFHMKSCSVKPDEALLILDQHLEGLIPDGFLAAFAGTIHKTDQNDVTLTLANSCQPPILHYKAKTGDVQLIKIHSESAIGLGICESFECSKLELDPGDCVLLMSDGAIECCDPEGNELGSEGLIQTFQRSAEQPIERILEDLQTYLKTYSGNNYPQDDTTLLLFRAKSGSL